MAFTSGLITGLMGYSLKKEMMDDALFFRETQTFSYEIYSVDLTGHSPFTIQKNIYNEFKNKYSGDINVKVFSQPADYYFPNDSIRVAKFDVDVQIRSVPNIDTWQPELATNYYKGLDSAFFKGSGNQLLNFKEGFDFETTENGTQIFSHNIAFGLITGDKPTAIAIASGIFSKDKDTTFGISNMVGNLLTIADSSQYQNYFHESYDTIRNTYNFLRKREVLPSGVSAYLFNLIHTYELREDGLTDVTEKGNVKAKLAFSDARIGAENLLGSAYTRCSSVYNTYAGLSNWTAIPVTLSLVAIPVKTNKVWNRPAMTVDYDVSYTNNPQFANDGTQTEEILDLSDVALGILDVKHSFSFSQQKRLATTTFDQQISSAIASSPGTVASYVTAYNPLLAPVSNIREEIAWPNRKPKGAKVILQYSNHPKYFININGITYNMLEYKVNHTKPVDIITEYKVINRPTKLSVINYAYQTEKGQLSVTLDASIGRMSDEFVSGFRTDIGNYLYSLYNYAIQIFFDEFLGTIPLAFTYFLQDVKYSYAFETGLLQLVVTFNYSIKKYTL